MVLQYIQPINTPKMLFNNHDPDGEDKKRLLVDCVVVVLGGGGEGGGRNNLVTQPGPQLELPI